MFKRDIDQLEYNNNQHRFMSQGPPEHNDSPIPPPFRGLPFFGLRPPFKSGHLIPPLPIGREAFQEIRDFILLLIISEHPNGITGYQLQEKYNFPRGSLIRTLQDLEEKKYIKSKEEIVEGRANKFYLVTESGKKFIEELKLRWANLFSMMSEINPSEGFRMMISEKIKQFETKDDAIDFFRGIRSWMKSMVQSIERRTENFKKTKVDLDKIIEQIEKMENLDKHKVMDLVKESIKKMKENET